MCYGCIESIYWSWGIANRLSLAKNGGCILVHKVGEILGRKCLKKMVTNRTQAKKNKMLGESLGVVLLSQNLWDFLSQSGTSDTTTIWWPVLEKSPGILTWENYPFCIVYLAGNVIQATPCERLCLKIWKRTHKPIEMRRFYFRFKVFCKNISQQEIIFSFLS